MTREQYLKNLEPPRTRVDVILDTDTYNEVDDQYAMAWLLHSFDKINLVGITAVPFFNSNSSGPRDGMEKSYDEIMNLLALDGKNELRNIVYRGATDTRTRGGTAICRPLSIWTEGVFVLEDLV